ncbi:MAG: ATP-binding protein [Vicinamibacterales bacterium]
MAYWLVLAATLLLIIGIITFQRIGVGTGATVGDRGLSQAMVVATSVLAMLSVLIAGLQMRAESRHRQQVELELQDALASVERQVSERTLALSRAMAELKVSEQQFRLITDLSPVHLFRAGPDGEAKYLSPGFMNMTGMTARDALGYGWIQAVHPEDRERLMANWQEALRSQTIFQAEFRFRTATGDMRWYRARVVPDRDDSGGIVGWVGASVDLHELHLALDEKAAALAKAEEARRSAEEASHLKDEFLATASHELRTPLNAIVGWVHVLQSGGVLDDQQRQHAVGAIDRNAKVQTRLIEDLLDVSRMIQGRVSLTVAPIDARGVVDAAIETLRPAAAAKEVAVHVASPIEPVPVIGDAQRLQQVVWNLLANAIKYTPRGGTISVTVQATGDRVGITVADTGEGIDPAFLPHIFEPFRQGTSASMRTGMGLGLAIVQRLVDLHGGRITAASGGVGQGSQFHVSLPMAPAATLAAVTAGPREPMFQRLHVLVAEDDADSAAAVTAILRLHGCETQTAGTASECLRITGEWPTDVLVCDIGLPDDDGYGLLRRLRNLPEGERIPAIALTAYARPEDRARALAAGFCAHLAKPLDPASLLREISSAVKALSSSSTP